jgi:hypothetical protein
MYAGLKKLVRQSMRLMIGIDNRLINLKAELRLPLFFMKSAILRYATCKAEPPQYYLYMRYKIMIFLWRFGG